MIRELQFSPGSQIAQLLSTSPMESRASARLNPASTYASIDIFLTQIHVVSTKGIFPGREQNV